MTLCSLIIEVSNDGPFPGKKEKSNCVVLTSLHVSPLELSLFEKRKNFFLRSFKVKEESY